MWDVPGTQKWVRARRGSGVEGQEGIYKSWNDKICFQGLGGAWYGQSLKVKAGSSVFLEGIKTLETCKETI